MRELCYITRLVMSLGMIHDPYVAAMSPLVRAVFSGNRDEVKLLIEPLAKLDKTDKPLRNSHRIELNRALRMAMSGDSYMIELWIREACDSVKD